ncbi:hypothetical protein LTR62_005309 [Meristemomyces frigidus]|uniref:ER transporter 6TM N-terminal domain-containing protein n=1 Tax=Meristemomyces frigidus TaxID=1508187 RepID=A0AAN7TDR1_9PEZI|nr:hypothetical protein LTR62_005309 [Meristemomyces frigidus]
MAAGGSSRKTSPDGGNEPDHGASNESSGSAGGSSQPKQPSTIKRLWNKAGLDQMTLTLMLKGSIPPTIAIAMYQSTAVATEYSTLGYLVAITSILGFAIMPRGKFIQTMSLNIIAVCFAAAMNLLALYCVTQARLRTTIPYGKPLQGYNSSASAVCAVWLMVQLYIINAVRAARPQFQFPAIIYSIFVSVSLTYGTQFPNMASALSFMQRLLEAFLSGFAIASGVSLFVFPISSRTVVFKEMTGYMMCLSGMLQAQCSYMQNMETLDPMQNHAEHEKQRAAEADKAHHHHKQSKVPLNPLATPASAKLKELLGKTLELHTKLHVDLIPAKREFAYGKLESHDLTQLWKLLRMFFVPCVGLSASMDLIQRLAADSDWAHESHDVEEQEGKHRHIENLHFVMKQLHQPFAAMTAEIQTALQHVLITLEFVKAPKAAHDEESEGEQTSPGSPGFAAAYKRKLDDFYNSKKVTLREWCEAHNISIPEDFFETTFVRSENSQFKDENKRDRYQRQLFFMLYLEYLLWRAGGAALDVVLWADKRKAEGALKRNKLIFPGSRTLYKWLISTFGKEDLSNDGSYMAEADSGSSEAVFLGQEFAKRKDAEHLPPRNLRERIGESIREIPKFFRSDASAFGFRVVCATMSIAIICYLEATQNFFLKQRLLWAMIMVAISMSRTAGQSTFNFALRVLGTAIAMTGSYIIWYIVDGQPAGVIVFLWAWIFGAFYFVIKFPKFLVVALLSLVTAVLIVGYELQVKKIGVQASTSNGQPAYPTYLLAPYRLATVAGGLGIAFIWTIFPFPVSESTELRKDLGASLYLLSNFYSIVHETVRSRVSGKDGNAKTKGTHAFYLEKARDAVFSKSVFLLNNLNTNAQFSKFQLRVGGRFPREEYEGLIEASRRVLQYSSLISYASSTFSVHRDGATEEPSQWSTDFRKIVSQIDSTSHRVTSLLALLSSSISHGQPLPPYLDVPQPFQFVKQLHALDPDLLSVRHIAEPEYSAFAVLQVCAQAISEDVAKLKRHVTNLVGETDFSFHAVKSSGERNSSASTDDDDDDEKEKRSV